MVDDASYKEEKPKKKINQKLIIIISVALVILIAIGVLLYLLLSDKADSEDDSKFGLSLEELEKRTDPK